MLTVEYIAGFMDGEGSFYLCEDKRKNCKRFKPHISIANTNELVMQLIGHTLRSWCIDCVVRYQKPQRAGWKHQYVLAINSQESIYLLCGILVKKLVVKQHNAELLLEFTMLRKIEGERGRQFYKREVEIYEEMLVLNKRGT